MSNGNFLNKKNFCRTIEPLNNITRFIFFSVGNGVFGHKNKYFSENICVIMNFTTTIDFSSLFLNQTVNLVFKCGTKIFKSEITPMNAFGTEKFLLQTRLILGQILFIFKIKRFYLKRSKDFAQCFSLSLKSTTLFSVRIPKNGSSHSFLCLEYTRILFPGLQLRCAKGSISFVKASCTQRFTSKEFISACVDIITSILFF